MRARILGVAECISWEGTNVNAQPKQNVKSPLNFKGAFLLLPNSRFDCIMKLLKAISHNVASAFRQLEGELKL